MRHHADNRKRKGRQVLSKAAVQAAMDAPARQSLQPRKKQRATVNPEEDAKSALAAVFGAVNAIKV